MVSLTMPGTPDDVGLHLRIQVECEITKDMLRGADFYELRLKLLYRQPE